MLQFQHITPRSVSFVESWISDLQKLRYLEPPIIPRRRGYMNPCLGADGLNGVSFYPALPPRTVTLEQLRRRNVTLERYQKEEALLDTLNRAHGESLVRKIEIELDESNSTSAGVRSGKGLDLGDEADHLSLVREFTESACPGYAPLLPHKPETPMHNVLLIIAMTALRYELIPVFEVVYREQFPNILYCGAPHDSIDPYLRKYQVSEDRSFSFLPVHTKYTYECVMGALEMGYNVDGYLMTTDDALINNWNIPSLNISQLWYSGDYSIQVSANEWKTLDPGGQKLPRSLEGVLKVLEFLKSSLIGSTDERSIYHEYKTSGGRLSKREAELSHSTAENAPVSFIISTDQPAESLTRHVHEKSAEEEAADHKETTPRNALSDTLKLPLNKEGLVFDLVELKSFDDEKNDHPDVHGLPSLKYEVAPEENVTDSSAEEPQEPPQQIEIIDAVISLLPATETEVNQETNPTSESDEEETVSPAEDESEEEEAEEADFTEPERPVPEVLRELLVATRNTSQDVTSTTTESVQLEVSSSTTEAGSTSQVSDLEAAAPVEELPLPEDSANISHVAGEIFHLDDEWSDPSNGSETPSIEIVLHDPSEHNSGIVVDIVEPSHVSPEETTLLPETPNEPSEREPSVEEPEAPLVVEEPEYQLIEGNATGIDQATAPDAESAADDAKPPTSDEKPAQDEERRSDSHVDDLLSALQEIYGMIKENLGVPSDPGAPSVDVSFYGADRTPYRLNPKSIHHFRCEKGTKLEFCKVSSEFLYQLSENNGKQLRLIYDKVPLYFIPKRDQLKFYLLSNLMHQHGVTDEIAVPLMLTGLSSEHDWVKLHKSHFGGHRAESSAANKYPLFDSTAHVLYPADLNALVADSKLNKVFCLKYLLRLLQS